MEGLANILTSKIKKSYNNSARKKSYLFVLLASIFVSPAGLAMTLPNGGVVSDAISVSGEIDEYTFTATAGHTVYIRIADAESTEFVSSPFSPFIELLDPNGSLIASASGALVGDIARFLVVTGRYTVRVSDGSFRRDETGSYNLYFARAPGANDDGLLPNGGTVSGEIDLGDIDSYRFTASAGETVYLRVADTETTEFIPSSFAPAVILLSPSGSVVTSGSGALVGDIARTLVESGTYTVIIVDESFGEDETGSYDLYYAKAPGANNDGCIANGQSANGFIDLGDIDSYSFQANAGTSFLVTVSDLTGGDFSPAIILLDPSGTVITSNVNADTAQISRTLPVTGEYSLFVFDESFGEDATGSYRIDISGVSVTCPAPITPTAEVTLVHSCLAGLARFDVNVVNTQTAVSTYTFNLQGQSPRTRVVEFENWGRMPITGRAPGSYTAEVLRDGVQILSDTVEVNCGAPVPPVSSPEVALVNACVAGNGFVLFQMVNPTNTPRPYVIEFEGLATNRSTTAAAYGQAVRGRSGRPDGVFNYLVRTGSTVVANGAVEVDCD